MSVVANVAVNVDARNAIQQLRQVQAQSQTTERAVNGLGAAVGKLAAAFAAIQAVKFAFVQAAELETQRRSLEVLTGSVQRANQIIKELQDLGAVTPFTSTELIDAAKRLQAFGVEAENVVETTRRLADVSGATGAELQGLVTAYGQVQAKGRLQGEELLQFQERGVALQKVLKEEYKLSGEEFQDALSKGRISAEAVEFAVKKLTDAGGKYANGAIAQSDTLNGKLSTLQDSFQRLAQNIGKFFEPVFKFLIDGINAFIERVNSASRLQAGVQAYQEAATRTKQKFGIRAINPFDKEVQEYRARLEKSLLPSMMGGGGVKVPQAPSAGTPPPLLSPTGKGGGRGARGGGDAARAADAAARIQAEVQGLQRQTALTQQLAFIQEQIANAEADKDQLTVIRLQNEEKLLELQYRLAEQLAGSETTQQRIAFQALAQAEADKIRLGTAIALSAEEEKSAEANREKLQSLLDEQELLTAKINGNEAEVLLRQQIRDIMKDTKGLSEGEVESLLRGNEALKNRLKTAEEMKQIYADIGTSIKEGVVSSIQGAIDGTRSLQDVATNLLQKIANQLLDIAVNLALFGVKSGTGTGGGLLGFLFRANGGPVNNGSPYIVGERGPELFVPNSSGTIIPNNRLGGGGGDVSVTVNVDASGSQVQGDQGQAKALGSAISAAVQAEIVKQQRPGGLLAGTR